MANGIRTGDPHGFNNGCSLKLHVGSWVWQTPEEGRRTYWPKHCGNNNKDEDNSPKTLNEKNHQALSQKFRQLRNLMLFEITKRCNIRVKWRGWQKEHIRQVMMRQLWTQPSLGEKLVIAACNTKCVHYLLGMSDKVGEASRWKHMVLIEIKEMSSKKLGH